MDSLTADGLKRTYQVIAPGNGLSKSAPIIVFLSGKFASIALEEGRDDLIPYAASGQTELVYPVAVSKSWNAGGGCCGAAGVKNVNDLAFIQALVAKVDPGRAHPVYLVGSSNGARLAYWVVCDDPDLFDGYAMVEGEPTGTCNMRKPVSIVQIATLNDPEVPYKPGEDKHSPEKEGPVTTLVDHLRVIDQCSDTGKKTTHTGTLTLTRWPNCAPGVRLALAAWKFGKHAIPAPPVNTPAAAQYIWAFFMKKPLAPLPKA